eukprot:CAMPEP_0115015438 /NCGR_PEP_ID=MMETSP0216-20121206/26775_1 /TAXON_ID=223996 /ORGANISM="Protocruzia adherens, Strain Boccale" /LENGTH=144 /DNA_ID=CAMNT_0002385571 /DNA_START=25 /DNA_END=459 /DNA_ORIENTATION=+
MYKGHPGAQQRDGVSGLQFFDGEDEEYERRLQQQKIEQREWNLQQMREKKMLKEQEKQEERMFAQQTEEMTRLRGLLEQDKQKKQKMMQASMRDQNMQLNQEKADKEKTERLNKLAEEKQDIDDYSLPQHLKQRMMASNGQGFA